jgi:nucleoid-associated protein YgaU
MTKQNDVSELPKLPSVYRYENFFQVHINEEGRWVYNILKGINVFPANNSSVEDEYIVVSNDTWYLISYKYYKTMDLWWLVCEYNQIKDATKKPNPGDTLKLLKSDYVWPVISNLNLQINN